LLACLVEVVLNLRADEKLLLLVLHALLLLCRAAAVRARVQNDQSDRSASYQNNLRSIEQESAQPLESQEKPYIPAAGSVAAHEAVVAAGVGGGIAMEPAAAIHVHVCYRTTWFFFLTTPASFK
jgi:hypothetical protein